MSDRKQRESELSLTLNSQQDCIYWQTHKLVSFLRNYPSEIDRVGPNSPIDQRFNELGGGISLLTELGEGVRTVGIFDGRIDYPSSRMTALQSINTAIHSIIDITRCDEKRLSGRDE